MNESKAMYNAVSIVSEHNKVRGFDPTRFLRKTKDGPKLDLSIKKLWFRLKYPNGRIKLSALKITDQLAIIEARVYLDKSDTTPVTTFTSQKENSSTPGGLYIEIAQHNAMDEALTAAGFDVQFVSANGIKASPAPAVPTQPVVREKVVEPTVKAAAEPIVAPKETVATKASEEPTHIVSEAVPDIPVANEASVPATVEETVSAPIITKPIVEATPVVEVTEIREEDSTLPYTKDMPVEMICSLMSVEEAKNYIVPSGTCKGWTLSQVAERRRPSLAWYVQAYTGDDNILRAGATIMQRLLDS